MNIFNGTSYVAVRNNFFIQDVILIFQQASA